MQFASSAFSTSVQTPSVPKLTTQSQSALAIWVCTFHSKNHWEYIENHHQTVPINRTVDLNNTFAVTSQLDHGKLHEHRQEREEWPGWNCDRSAAVPFEDSLVAGSYKEYDGYLNSTHTKHRQQTTNHLFLDAKKGNAGMFCCSNLQLTLRTSRSSALLSF